MGVSENPPTPTQSNSPRDDLVQVLGPGVVSLDAAGKVRFADQRALELLSCADGFELERLWEELQRRLETSGLGWNGTDGTTDWAALDLPVAGSAAAGETGGQEAAGTVRRLLFNLRRDPESGGILLVQDLGTLTGLETDLRLTSQMRSVAQISPAVAHDLRAPINAMVFNLEVLQEMIASGRAADPANREKLLRYVSVLKEELSRLHRGLETFLGYISPRSDRIEALDLGELIRELASLLVAPARKQQVQVEVEVAAEPLPVEGNRYLLRQALLHLALSVLTEVPKQGTLHLRLERLDESARLSVYGVAGAESPAAAEVSTEPDMGFDLRFSPSGALARLWVARSILAGHGGEVRASGPGGRADTGNLAAYEVELRLLGHPSIGTKE